jgi:hypothetical protein
MRGLGSILIALVVGSGVASLSLGGETPGETPLDSAEVLEALMAIELDMPGWVDAGMQDDMRGWSDGQGDFLSLVVTDESLGLPPLSDRVALQESFRGLAESRGAGLIEVVVSTDGPMGPTASLIYKRLEKPAYVYTGMLIVSNARPSQVWTVVAVERGTTGVREAVIAGELIDAGKMTIEDYERSWAKDPYDPDYRGVDRSVLRFVSDDESYDERFPEHPLSRVRRILAALPNAVHVEEAPRER